MNTAILYILLTLSSAIGERVYADAPRQISDSAVTLVLDPATDMAVSAEARVALMKIPEGQGLARSWWSLLLVSPGDTVDISLRHGNSNFGDILDRRFTRLSVRRGEETLFDEEVEGFATSSGGYNTLSASIDSDGRLKVSGGGKSRKRLAEIPVGDSFFPHEASVRVRSGEGVLSLFCVEGLSSPEKLASTGWTMETLREHIASSTDPAEGFWKYLDRENDPEYARPGGRYTLATVRNDAGHYDIIYIDGAQTYGDRWKPMMLKGVLLPTIFSSHYDLNWYDSAFEAMDEDIHADITDGAILTLSFPLLKTKLRFSKMPL